MKTTIAVAALMLSSSIAFAGDLTITTRTSGNVKDISTSYMTAGKVRTNSTATGYDVLHDYQKGVTYIINHKAKTITYTNTADLPAYTAFVAAHTPKGKGMENFYASMDGIYGDPSIFKVENLGKDVVMGRACNRTRITAGNLVWEFSMDPTLRSPIDPAIMMKETRATFMNQMATPKMAKILSNLNEAQAKLQGVALKSKMTGYNGETDSEVTSVSQAAIPASVFVLPAGYAMKNQLAETEARMARHSKPN